MEVLEILETIQIKISIICVIACLLTFYMFDEYGIVAREVGSSSIGGCTHGGGYMLVRGPCTVPWTVPLRAHVHGQRDADATTGGGAAGAAAADEMTTRRSVRVFILFPGGFRRDATASS